METNLLWSFALLVAVLGVLGAWFHWCGRADEGRRMRAFGMTTLRYAGAGLVLGVAYFTSDIGSAPPAGHLVIVAVTVCCFLLVYAAGSAVVAANDQSLVVVNLTGRALLLSDPDLAPFYTLPARQEEPASVLPPVRPRTYYVVSANLGHVAAQAGRTDVFTVDPATTFAIGESGTMRVRRLLPATPPAAAAVQPENEIHS